MSEIEYDKSMLEEYYINRFLNMIANDYNGELAKIFEEKYIKKDKEIERLNNIINELEKSKEKQINDYEILILKIERYLNCYQYFLETQEENNKKIANMIHEFSLGSDKE